MDDSKAWQQDIFLPEQITRDVGRARFGGDHRWWLQRFGLPAVESACKMADEITMDDVRDHLGDAIPVASSVVGMAMVEARDRGWIRKTDRTRNSKRRECHNRPLAVWKVVDRAN